MKNHCRNHFFLCVCIKYYHLFLYKINHIFQVLIITIAYNGLHHQLLCPLLNLPTNIESSRFKHHMNVLHDWIRSKVVPCISVNSLPFQWIEGPAQQPLFEEAEWPTKFLQTGQIWFLCKCIYIFFKSYVWLKSVCHKIRVRISDHVEQQRDVAQSSETAQKGDGEHERTHEDQHQRWICHQRVHYICEALAKNK